MTRVGVWALLAALTACGGGPEFGTLAQADRDDDRGGDRDRKHCGRGHRHECPPPGVDAGVPFFALLAANSATYRADYGVFVALTLWTSTAPVGRTWVVNVFAPGDLPWLAGAQGIGTPFVFGLYPGAPQGTWTADGYVDGFRAATVFEVGP